MLALGLASEGGARRGTTGSRGKSGNTITCRWLGLLLLAALVVSLFLLRKEEKEPEGPQAQRHLYRLNDNTFERGIVVDETADGEVEGEEFRQKERPRDYVLHVPDAVHRLLAADPAHDEVKVPLVLCFHGMTRTGWYTALNETSWLERAERDRFVVAFPQSLGSHNMWGGRTGWTIDSDEDVIYTRALVEDIRKDYGRVLDTKRTYVIGLSNGGIFLSTLLLDKHVRFAAACIYIGGYVIGQNPEVDGTQAKTPLLLVTGSLDSMLPYSREAEKVFKEAGHHVEFELVEGMKHEYRKSLEDLMWSFLSKYRL